MNLNWDGPPADPYVLQACRDLEKLMEFILRILEPRIADSIGAIINTEFADVFYEEIKS